MLPQLGVIRLFPVVHTSPTVRANTTSATTKSSSTSDGDDDDDDDDSNIIGLVVGLVLGTIFLALLIAAIIWWIKKRKDSQTLGHDSAVNNMQLKEKR